MDPIIKIINSDIHRTISLLTKSEQLKVLLVIFLQITFGLLDLIGIAVVGILGALSIRGVQSQNPGDRVGKFLNYSGLDNFSFQNQIAILGIVAVVVLVCKTIFSLVFTRKILFFLSRRGAKISANMVSRLLTQSILTIQSKSIQEQIFGITTGVSIITVGILGSIVTLISDLSLLLILGIGLFFVDTTIAILTFLVFASIGLSLYLILHVRARALGVENARISVSSNEKISEILTSYRESVVKNRRSYYVNLISKQRLVLADTTAELAFMPNISKYVIEVTVVLSSLLISAIEFKIHDASHAVGVLSVFIAASSRIAPAVLRIQQGAIQIKGNIGIASPTLDLIESLGSINGNTDEIDPLNFNHEGFDANIVMNELSFTYPQSNEKAINNVSLEIKKGEMCAFVGPSGAGKTTIVDLMLNVLTSSTGNITISGVSPADAISKWPGALAYVPQDVVIVNGNISENVSLGFPNEEVLELDIWNALDVAQLTNFVKSLPNGLDTQVGDRGTRLSGGQRQRLGIARAMFTKPLFLILDEATSSLDGETEAKINEEIQKLKSEVTVVVIAHRLSTVRNSDQVVYMESGKVLAVGSFLEVRRIVPNFDKHAKLMGL